MRPKGKTLGMEFQPQFLFRRRNLGSRRKAFLRGSLKICTLFQGIGIIRFPEQRWMMAQRVRQAQKEQKFGASMLEGTSFRKVGD